MTTTEKLIDDYVDELRRDLSELPRAARREVVQEIEEHIAAARADLEEENEAAVRDVLDRLGDPADIAEEARERFGIRPRKRTWVETLALILLPLGGVVIPVVGWLVGVILLWLSSAWTKRDKILGTLIIPGGLTAPVFMFFLLQTSGEVCSTRLDSAGHVIRRTCTGGPSTFEKVFWPTLFGILLIAPIAMTIYLARRSGRAVAA